MKKFFKKIGGWFKRHAPTKRRLIQIYSALLFNSYYKGFFSNKELEIYQGGTKKFCVPGLNCYSCPGAVGSCPLGALQNALMNSDTTVPAYIFGILVLLGLLLGRTVCGFLCPIGLGQDLLYKIPSPKLKKNRGTKALSYLKYLILAVFVVMIPLTYLAPGFCKYICPSGTLIGGIFQLFNPSNGDVFTRLGILFSWKFILLVAFIVSSVFIYRPFCRFFCPLGAIYGFFCKVALLGVKLDKNKCTDCGLCVSVCKMDISRVGDHECISCGKCIKVCPTKAISWKGKSLFVKENQLDVPASAEIKPLASFLQKTEPTPVKTTVPETPVVETTVSETPVAMESAVTVNEPLSAEEKFAAYKKKEKKRNFILQAVAWSLAMVLLGVAIVYYNFIYESPSAGVEKTMVGSACPDFTMKKYEKDGDGNYYLSEETVTLSDYQGKVVVVNLWATWCGPCIEELPHFNEVYEEYSGEIELFAINGDSSAEDVSLSINGNDSLDIDWRDYSITFLQNGKEPNYLTEVLGSTGLPITMILDTEGVVRFRTDKAIEKDELKAEIDKVLALSGVE